MWATEVANRLRALRRELKLGQDHVAGALDISVSEISRLERGVRGLRVEQLGPWARSLARRAEVVFWIPGNSPASERHLDPEALRVLEEVAGALHHMPPLAREALLQQMRVWSRSSRDPSG